MNWSFSDSWASTLTAGGALLGTILSAVARASETQASDDGPSYQGYVWAFLLACLLTLWAVIGELATISVLLEELTSGTLSPSFSWLFLILLIIAAILLVVYAWGTIRATISFKDEQVTTARGDQITRRRRWSLL